MYNTYVLYCFKGTNSKRITSLCRIKSQMIILNYKLNASTHYYTQYTVTQNGLSPSNGQINMKAFQTITKKNISKLAYL